MQKSIRSLAVFLLAPGALAQTEQLFEIVKPQGNQIGWGQSVTQIHDVSLDGIPDIAVGIATHGGNVAGTVHSGADGTFLFALPNPGGPMWQGFRIRSVHDMTGDGIPELVSLAAHSNDSNSPHSRMYVNSGADGTLVQQWQAPTGVEWGTSFVSLGDVNADGIEDLLLPAWDMTQLPRARWIMMSPATGEVLYSAFRAGNDQSSFQQFPALLSDHDSDGIADFALQAQIAGVLYAELRSGATGQVLGLLPLNGSPLLTGNGEPFVGIADLDGDGKRDLAVGGTFQGFTAVHSTQDGATLRRWDCSQQPIDCFGSRILDVGDLNGNGSSDLLTIEIAFGSPTPMRLFGLDPSTGQELFEEVEPSFVGAYSNSERMALLSGIDPHGFPVIALPGEFSEAISFRRIALDLGKSICEGPGPVLRAVGTPSLTQELCMAELHGAPALSPFLLLQGVVTTTSPFAPTGLCIGRPASKLAVGWTDAQGFWSAPIGLSKCGAPGASVGVQALFRGGRTGGMLGSNALQLRLLP